MGKQRTNTFSQKLSLSKEDREYLERILACLHNATEGHARVDWKAVPQTQEERAAVPSNNYQIGCTHKISMLRSLLYGKSFDVTWFEPEVASCGMAEHMAEDALQHDLESEV